MLLVTAKSLRFSSTKFQHKINFVLVLCAWCVLHCVYSISQEICTRFLLCFVVVIHRLIFPYPSGLLHWHCGNLTIAPVPAKQPWWIWINTSCEFIMNDCITTTKQSTTKPCAYFLGYTVAVFWLCIFCDHRRPHIHTSGSSVFTLSLHCYRAHSELKMVSNQSIVNTKKSWIHTSTNL